MSSHPMKRDTTTSTTLVARNKPLRRVYAPAALVLSLVGAGVSSMTCVAEVEEPTGEVSLADLPKTYGTITCNNIPVDDCEVYLKFYDSVHEVAEIAALTDSSGKFEGTVACGLGNNQTNEHWRITFSCSQDERVIYSPYCWGDLGLYKLNSSCGCVERPADIVDWWPFDNGSPCVTADIEYSSHNNGERLPSGAGPTFVPGKVSNALSFDGIDDYISVSHHSEVDFSGSAQSFTIDAWISTTQTNGVLLDKRSNPNLPKGFSLFLSNGHLGFQMATGQGTTSACGVGSSYPCTNYINPSSLNIADGGWHLVAVTVNRATSTGTFYVDGNAIYTFTPRSGDMANSAALYIGRSAKDFSPISYLNGKLDELQFFKRALSPQEIQAISGAEYGTCKVSQYILNPICSVPDTGNPSD